MTSKEASKAFNDIPDEQRKILASISAYDNINTLESLKKQIKTSYQSQIKNINARIKNIKKHAESIKL